METCGFYLTTPSTTRLLKQQTVGVFFHWDLGGAAYSKRAKGGSSEAAAVVVIVDVVLLPFALPWRILLLLRVAG